MYHLGFLDISMIIILSVLASLSKRLGEALKVAPYYKFYQLAVVAISMAAFLDSGSYTEVYIKIPLIVTLILRIITSLLALFATFKYWHWIFAEMRN